MQLSLTQIIERTTNNIKNLVDLNDQKAILKELVQILFEQYKEVADCHYVFMMCVEQAKKAHNVEVNSYDTQYFWSQVQTVVSLMNILNYFENLYNIPYIETIIIGS